MVRPGGYVAMGETASRATLDDGTIYTEYLVEVVLG